MTTSTAVAQRTIDAGGIGTSYLEAGSGEPVLMLHGSGPGVSGLANWQHNIPSLSHRQNGEALRLLLSNQRRAGALKQRGPKGKR